MMRLGYRYLRLGRIVERAETRARRRFAAMIDRRTTGDPSAPETLRYVEAERLLDRLASPEAILGREQ